MSHEDYRSRSRSEETKLSRVTEQKAVLHEPSGLTVEARVNPCRRSSGPRLHVRAGVRCFWRNCRSATAASAPGRQAGTQRATLSRPSGVGGNRPGSWWKDKGGSVSIARNWRRRPSNLRMARFTPSQCLEAPTGQSGSRAALRCPPPAGRTADLRSGNLLVLYRFVPQCRACDRDESSSALQSASLLGRCRVV
jgi:hypothetical protein